MPVDIFKQKLQRSGRTEQHIKTQCRRSKRELEEKCITIKVLKDELNMILNDNRSRGRSVFGESCGDSHALKGLKKELKEVRHLVSTSLNKMRSSWTSRKLVLLIFSCV